MRGERERALLRIELLCQVEQRLKIRISSCLFAGRLVGDAPHDDARMVLIALDHIAQDLPVMLLGAERFPGGRVHVDLHPRGGKRGVHADGRRLVDDEDAHPVAQAHHFLAVWIVARAEGVRAQPF